LRVLPDGSWRVGEAPVAHPRSLRYFKQRLSFEEAGAFIVDGAQRMPVILEGPPFLVELLTFDTDRGELRARLDDGTEERLDDPTIVMSRDTGLFECEVKGGRARAALSRAAHDAVLERLEEDGGEFFVPLGSRRCRVVP
jgi:hypothetical protein